MATRKCKQRKHSFYFIRIDYETSVAIYEDLMSDLLTSTRLTEESNALTVLPIRKTQTYVMTK